ncbi:MAG TPA: hypothetical protein VFN74_00515 [Chloroflexota bacterium]|nr:hypothetical protein [Chloroflexota bacterium]
MLRVRRRLLLLVRGAQPLGSAALTLTGVARCGPPSTAVDAEDDQKLLQEIRRRQEQRVAQARGQVAELEGELRLVQMRRRMLERAGRHDLAAAADLEEYGLRV